MGGSPLDGSVLTGRVFRVLVLYTRKSAAILHTRESAAILRARKSTTILHSRESAAIPGPDVMATRMVIMIVDIIPAVSFCDLIDVRIKLDELIGNVDQPRAGVAAKARQFDAHAFVGDGVYRVGEVLVA